MSSKLQSVSSFREHPAATVTTRQLELKEKHLISFQEGDTVKFTCTGNIGNPPGKFIWQKISLIQEIPITYSNEITEKTQINGKCSYRGTSNLTVQITTEDLTSVYRCFEESQADMTGMYEETGPFNVLCEYKKCL